MLLGARHARHGNTDMIDLSMAALIAAFIAGVLGFSGMVDAGWAKLAGFGLLALALGLVATAVAQRGVARGRLVPVA
jgi:hypothetical protein